MPSLIEIGPVILEKKILKFRQCIFTILLFCSYIPLKNCVVVHLNKFESPSPKDALCQYGWNWLSNSREAFKFINVFSLFRNYLPFEMDEPLHLNPHHQKMFSAKFGWNWPSGSEEDF